MPNTTALPKIIVLLGPTASGKTAWGLQLAKKFHGEIISADSRQVYRKMDIGTAKPEGRWQGTGKEQAYYVDGVRHHLVDFLDPGKIFTAAEWREAAITAITSIYERKNTPIIVGGTGLYISTLVDNWNIPRIPPNKTLRASLEEKSAVELTRLLAVLDPAAAEVIDVKNKRRLVRALEVSILSGVPFSKQRTKGKSLVNALLIGIDIPRAVLHKRIAERVDAMMALGLVSEVTKLLKQKYGWRLPSMSGIGYQQFKGYTEGSITLAKAVEQLKRDTRHFARRQLTWFRRDQRIHWCRAYKEAEQLAKSFLTT